jgi:hypothetical protein
VCSGIVDGRRRGTGCAVRVVAERCQCLTLQAAAVAGQRARCGVILGHALSDTEANAALRHAQSGTFEAAGPAGCSLRVPACAAEWRIAKDWAGWAEPAALNNRSPAPLLRSVVTSSDPCCSGAYHPLGEMEHNALMAYLPQTGSMLQRVARVARLPLRSHRFAVLAVVLALLTACGVRGQTGTYLVNVVGTPTQWDWAGNGALRGVLFTPGVQMCLSSLTWLQLGEFAHKTVMLRHDPPDAWPAVRNGVAPPLPTRQLLASHAALWLELERWHDGMAVWLFHVSANQFLLASRP